MPQQTTYVVVRRMKMNNKIEPGDVIQVRSGGPEMTCVGINDNHVKCLWLNDNQVIRNEEILTIACFIVRKLHQSK